MAVFFETAFIKAGGMLPITEGIRCKPPCNPCGMTTRSAVRTFESLRQVDSIGSRGHVPRVKTRPRNWQKR